MKLPELFESKMFLVVVLLGTLGCILFIFHREMPLPAFRQGFKDTVVLDTSRDASMFPYTTDPINSLDQYELEAVFSNEGDRELKKQQINQLTRRYPLDWTNYPPNSSKFQSEQAKYIEGFSSDSSAAELNSPYKDIGDGNLTPPDNAAVERQEKEILATYKPRKAGSMTTYDTYDAQEILEQIYKPKGIQPIVQRKEGNVFEVVSTRSLKNEVQYEDDLPDAPVRQGGSQAYQAAGEARIEVPPTAMEVAAGNDPFYEPTTSTRSSRSDYTKWTPGMERMFAPTYPTTDWIGQPK
jgi:hypothetical protein